MFCGWPLQKMDAKFVFSAPKLCKYQAFIDTFFAWPAIVWRRPTVQQSFPAQKFPQNKTQFYAFLKHLTLKEIDNDNCQVPVRYQNEYFMNFISQNRGIWIALRHNISKFNWVQLLYENIVQEYETFEPYYKTKFKRQFFPIHVKSLPPYYTRVIFNHFKEKYKKQNHTTPLLV